MSPPSATPRPRRRRCRRPQSATSPQDAARTARPRKTGRRYAWRACNDSATSAASVSSPATVACRNEAGRQRDLRRADRDRPAAFASAPVRHGASAAPGGAVRQRATALRSSLAGSGPEPRTSTSRPLSVAVIWMSSGLPVEISGSAIAQAASIAPLRARVENRAAIDRDDVVRIGRGKADLEHVMGAHPGVQGDAPAAGAMGVDQRTHLACDASACASVSTTRSRFQAR